MPKERKGEGFQAAAGLIRYFDSEADKAIKVPPWLVVGMAIASGVIIAVISFIWPAA